MQIKEALEFWKFKYKMTKDYNDIHWEASERREHEEYVKALKMAINALEKQIPKKVKVEKRSKDLSVLVCPICSKPSLVGMSYCRFCGQRLDWSEP